LSLFNCPCLRSEFTPVIARALRNARGDPLWTGK
jgi:hypothetical protein